MPYGYVSLLARRKLPPISRNELVFRMQDSLLRRREPNRCCGGVSLCSWTIPSSCCRTSEKVGRLSGSGSQHFWINICRGLDFTCEILGRSWHCTTLNLYSSRVRMLSKGTRRAAISHKRMPKLSVGGQNTKDTWVEYIYPLMRIKSKYLQTSDGRPYSFPAPTSVAMYRGVPANPRVSPVFET